MERGRSILFLLLTTAAGCDDPVQPDPPPTYTSCSPIAATPSDSVTELAWDDNQGVAHVAGQDWAVDGLQLRDAVLNESVRFYLEHPAEVLGVSVQWGNLPPGGDPTSELEITLHQDFGYNGFDFWPTPYSRLSRTLGEVEADTWTQYTLDRPFIVSHPGLLFVSHQRTALEDPAFLFDNSVGGDGDCATFDDCHSSFNLPEQQADSYYNGVSFRFQNDFMVRLQVRYSDGLTSEQTIFQDATGDLPIGTRHAWGDFDHDGDDDLLTPAGLLRNDRGSFVDVTESAGLAGALASGGVWGDYDNDGCLDLFLFTEATTAADALWRSNCDGTFTDMTAIAGIDDLQSYNLCENNASQNHQPSPAAAWWDVDNDGWLDLYVVGFICWPDWDFYRDQVFHNNADGTFSEWTDSHGFATGAFSGRGAAPIDYDQDGDVDLLVNNYTLHRNLFYLNNGDGTVTEMAESNGLAGEAVREGASFYYGHTIGAAWGDLDGDGDFDVVEANLAHPRFFHFSDRTRVLRNDGGLFTDLSAPIWFGITGAGLRYQETHSVPVLADFNRDGNLDLVLSAIYVGRPTDFYWGRGDGKFDLDSYHAGITTTNGWGMAASDYDLDGDVDLATSRALFENVCGDTGHWLQVRAIGNVASNWGAYGATVRVRVGPQVFLRHVQGGSGQGNQDSAYLHFGLGTSDTIDSVEVDFPGAGTVSYPGPFAAGQRLWLFEDGTVHRGWQPPG